MPVGDLPPDIQPLVGSSKPEDLQKVSKRTEPSMEQPKSIRSPIPGPTPSQALSPRKLPAAHRKNARTITREPTATAIQMMKERPDPLKAPWRHHSYRQSCHLNTSHKSRGFGVMSISGNTFITRKG